MLSSRLQLLLDTLQRLLRREAATRVERLLAKTRPEDVATVLQFIPERHRHQTFHLLPDDAFRAETLTELQDHLIVELLSERPAAEVAVWVDQMSADDQADVLALLPDALRDAVLDTFKPGEAEDVEELLQFHPETAGGIMATEFFARDEDTTAREAIEALQSAGEDVEMAFYVYVLSQHGTLVGVISLRALVVHAPGTALKDIMVTDVISVSTETDQEEVARLAARYNLLAVPVVDDANKLVGIVTIDDVIDVIREEATEDILKMAGADETAFQVESISIFRHFRTRAPWLFATCCGGLVASLLIGAFEEQLQAQVALAAFIPIVLGMGGNVGIQTATIMVRGIATGRVVSGMGWRFFLQESRIGLMLGVLYGLLLALYTLLRFAGIAGSGEGLALGGTVGFSILATLTVSASIGAIIPLACERLAIDPAVATGPVVTTAVDLFGIGLYFSIAAAFQGGLI